LREAFPRGELESQHPREGIDEMKLPHADFSVLGLGIKWRGGFWALGFGVRVRGESSGMSRAGHGEVREWLGEREESDLNDVGPKTIGSG